MEKKRRHVSPLEFGQAMISYKSAYPLEVVGCVSGKDERGDYYFPICAFYGSEHKELISGSIDGFGNREELLRYVGKCWDLAEKELEDIKRK